MNIDNLSDEEIRTLEAQKKINKFRPTGIHPDRVGIENMSDDQIRTLEVQRRNPEYGPSGIHPDRVGIENMSDDQIRTLEAQRRNPEYGPSGIHPDRVGIENMSDAQIRTLEAQVMERKQTDVPFKKYFKNLAKSPNITDQKEFEEATIRSMQSNGLIENFMFDIKSEIATKTADLKSTSKDDQEQVSKIKTEIEQLIVVYQKYLYELKKNQWNFKTMGNDIESMKIPQDVSDNLWKIQKEYGIIFELPIPADLGEDYGKAFERQGKLIPGLTLMYDDLSGKEVNWHQVMIFRENEKTPYERFKERREAKLKEFEAARQAEIQSTIANTMENNNGMGMR